MLIGKLHSFKDAPVLESELFRPSLIKRLIKKGEYFPSANSLLNGPVGECFRNCLYFRQDGQHVYLGFALAETDNESMWIPHAWLNDNGQTIETTGIAFHGYFGLDAVGTGFRIRPWWLCTPRL